MMVTRNGVVIIRAKHAGPDLLKRYLRTLLEELCPGGVKDEYLFLPDRKFRADFAVPDLQLVVEVQGGIWRAGGGAHQRSGAERDCAKSLAAAAAGWLVLPISTTMLRNDPDGVCEALRRVVEIRRAMGPSKGAV